MTMTKEQYIEENYDIIRYEYEQELMEHWYNPATVSEVDDGRDEFVNRYTQDILFDKE
jgi:hypothetical protein